MAEDYSDRVQLVRLKLKPEEASSFIEWVRSLNDRQDEVAEALRSEGIDLESMFVDSSGDQPTVYLYQSTRGLAAANAAFTESMLAVDVEARERMGRALLGVEAVPLVFHAAVKA